MFSYKYFFIILRFSVCILSSASEHKETAKQKSIESKLENKWNEKFEYLNERIDTMEANQETGSSIINEIKTDVAKLMNMVQQVFNKLEENSKKIEKCEDNFSEKLNNNSKIIEDNSRKIGNLMEKMGEKLNNTIDDVFSVYGSKCRSMCEVKGHSLINQTKATLEDQLESYLIEDNQKAVNVCSPNPCNGGQCMLNATGSGYICSNCPYPTYGNNCQNVKCDKENKCLKYNSTLYFVFETKLNWTEANRKCEAEGMTLAMPKDQESNEWLVSQLKPIYLHDVIVKNVYFWMGLKKNGSGQYRWTDGSPLGEYAGGRGDFKIYIDWCSLLQLDGGRALWDSSHCTHQYYPLCEKRVN